MGQRLVISLLKNNQEGEEYCIAKLYYHWSAYPLSSMDKVNRFADKFFYDEEFTKIQDERLRAIRIVESFGGGIDGGATSAEFEYIQGIFPKETFKTEGICRNEGLVAISKDGMDQLEYWSEGSVYINIDDKTIYNNLMWGYESIETLNDDYGFNPPVNIKMFTELPNDPEDCPIIDDYHELYDIITDNIDKNIIYANNKDKALATFNPYFYKYKNKYFYISE